MILFNFFELETLEKIDKDFFIFLNGMHNSFFDTIFYLSSLVGIWMPLYLFFTALVIKKFGKNCWVPLIGAVLLVIVTDRSSSMIKKSVMRYRPSYNIEIKNTTHIIKDNKGAQYGFVSSHAANTFGIALYMILLLRNKKKYFSFLILLWAAFVSYGRIYGGLHYPADIIGGAILGLASAFVIYKTQNYILLNKTNYKLSKK